MYIQLTEKCNMHCAHCCMSATNRGEDMSWETFKRAIQMAEEYGEYVTLGGGEPTLHSDFDRMLIYAIGHVEEVFIVTNGSQTDRALALAALAKRGVISCALSLDEWHDPIEDKVIEAFEKQEKKQLTCTSLIYTHYGTESSEDRREIRDVSKSSLGVFRQGRAARKSFVWNNVTQKGCACEGEPFVRPSGKVYQCGCKNTPSCGDVFNGFEPVDLDRGWECYRRTRKSQKTKVVEA